MKISHLIATWIAVCGILLFFLFPLAWMVMGAFKQQVDFTAYPPEWIFTPTWDNFRYIFLQHDYLAFLINSLIVALGATGIGLIIGLPAAYSISKFNMRRLATVILTARMTPGVAFLVPWFILFSRIGIIDTYSAMILTHLILVLPLIIWIMIGFFEDFPRDLEDAAMIDGCSIIGCFLRIVLPLVAPGIVTASILSIIFSWNNFMFSLVIGGTRTRTMPVAVFNFISWDSLNWGALTAAATVVTLPVLITALIVQRYIVKGLTMGALKD